MADVYGPFATGPWADGEWARFAPTWAPSGPIGTGAASATTGEWAFATSGLTVSAGAGRAWVRGFGLSRTGGGPPHTVTANTHATWSRRDRLVLRRDLTAGTVTTAVKTGSAASSPVAPSLTQSETGVWEETLFSFLTPPNSGTTIIDVVDERQWVRPDGLGLLVKPSPTTAGDTATKGYVDALGVAEPLPNTFALRDSSGWLRALGLYSLVAPFAPDHATNKAYVDAQRPRMMRAQRNINNDAFPNNAWTSFNGATDWTETDPWNMRGAGGTLTAPWTGWYQINVTLNWASNTTGNRGLALQPAAGVNIGEGAGQPVYLTYVKANSAGGTALSGSHITALTAGDSVTLSGFQDSGGPLTVQAVRISAAYLGDNAA